ncbi:uncharacterized protein LOC126894059 isoform X3 [Daktulosphaira vitifoliae]|uniref:uncharacterized protein LOC126894059 isoform X3 n=1 Tax=Daktulosphaira vitifoliae TaxID=58002 RepID=UPI0021AAFBE5|nr:uncharacterized protein LOC126894059 isoform X3 [Daktulosphaira vitifoliae]
MEFYSFILISIVIFVLNPAEGVKYNQLYKNYINTVVTHIHSKIGVNQMLNLKLKQFLNYPKIEENCKKDDFSRNYRYTISVLNYKYTEILKKFLDYMNIIIDECKQFHKRNLVENFINCVSLLEVEVKNSKTMFEKLYNAMKFISYIDIKYLFLEGLAPHPIIDEIDFLQQFVKELNAAYVVDINILPNLKVSITQFENFKSFYEVALKVVNNLFQNSLIIDTTIKTDLKKNQIEECSNETSFEIVYYTCNKLNSLYIETIKMWYKNLGFEHFLNPKTPQITPPKDPEIKQDDGIEALNILRLGTSWESMNHINIVYYRKNCSVNSIIKDEINFLNFRIKKEHVSQLLRCRYTEILKNYHLLLSTILHYCNNDSFNYQYSCLIELFKSFNKSKIMLIGLYNALITLNKSSIWIVHFRSHSSLHKILEWVAQILIFLKNNNYFKIDFVNKDDTENNNETLQKFQVIFNSFLNNFHHKIHSNISYLDSWCVFNEPFYEKNEKLNYFRTSKNILIDPNTLHQIKIYLNACYYFDNFCENVYNTCYKNLGFDKINCSGRKIDEKLIPFIKDLMDDLTT